MPAIGMIETRGLVAAIECSDVMTKSASVEILDKIHIGGGLVTVVVRGDVGSVKASIDAALTSLKGSNPSALVSAHVIANPHEELNQIFNLDKWNLQRKESIDKEPNIPEEPAPVEETVAIEEDISEVNEAIETQTPEKIDKAFLDRSFSDSGREGAEEVLKNLKINDLRRLIKEYKNLNISNKEAMKLSRKSLINKILNFYI